MKRNRNMIGKGSSRLREEEEECDMNINTKEEE